MLATAGMNTTGAAISGAKKAHNFNIKVLHCQRKAKRILIVSISFCCNMGKKLLFWGTFSMRKNFMCDNFPHPTLHEILQSYQYTLTVVQRRSLLHGVCGARQAINFDQKAEEVEIEVATIIASTGFDVYMPYNMPLLGYGKYPNVIMSI